MKKITLILLILFVLPVQTHALTIESKPNDFYKINSTSTLFLTYKVTTPEIPSIAKTRIWGGPNDYPCELKNGGSVFHTEEKTWTSGVPTSFDLMPGFLYYEERVGTNKLWVYDMDGTYPYLCATVYTSFTDGEPTNGISSSLVRYYLGEIDPNAVGQEGQETSNAPVVDFPEGDGNGFFDFLPIQWTFFLPLIIIVIIRRKFK